MKQLSGSNIFNALASPVLLLVGLVIYVVKFKQPSTAGQYGLTIFGCVCLAAWIYAAMRNTFNLFYDDQFLYLKGVLSQRKVPLQMVTRIQITNEMLKVMGITFWKYNVAFDPAAGIDDQPVWETWDDKDLDEFAAVVRQHNPGIIVRR
ncbi:hypothetical protein [Chryseolinea lacunae]|uniref:PH domain-containing protein n=1 Tax=Chryseolinea lacunae TaxID=2801331 RepID=A0ABS1KWI5_9BACT|nr:hypothetical protein [Chryseolinea lacunae]MBL0742671.1 hypothetical protein [Chryseolinea lacunae]